uniref:Glycoside hydrolase family 42 N-terminal domain-containing protein n=1 Tax=uncultured bacterium fosmid pJB92C9 TaxID=1478074 RepID=A0A0H3U8D7_9BACT|nr:hypothetical protein [uncultured bacterium fosmid pJB92C9]
MYFHKILFWLAAAVIMMAAACSKVSGDNPEIKPVPEEYHEFPIVAWTGIDAADAGRKLGPMKDCGFNIYLGWYDTFEEVDMMLKAADSVGVKVITASKNLLTEPQNEADKLKDYPALYGYFLADEPWDNDLQTLGDVASRIRAVDSEHLCYINLYPNWAWGGVDNYILKLTSYIDKVNPTMISFDFYPIYEQGGKSYVREEWFKNLEDVRRVSRAKKIPFWAFALSLAGTDGDKTWPVPTLGELRYQQFANLAYGAQGFQYWTYWGLYHNAPTPPYAFAKQVNKDLQILARYFYGADVTGVWHYGDEIPYGATKLSTMPLGVKDITFGGPAIISQFENNGKHYLAIVNKNYKQTMSFSVKFHNTAIKFDSLGYKSEVNETTTELDAGGIVVFNIQQI